MEMALNMGTFEALDYREMLEVDGGGGLLLGLAVGIVLDGVVTAATGRSCGGWVAYAIQKTPPKTPPIKNYGQR